MVPPFEVRRPVDDPRELHDLRDAAQRSGRRRAPCATSPAAAGPRLGPETWLAAGGGAMF